MGKPADAGNEILSRASRYGRVPDALIAEAASEECHLYAYLTTYDRRRRHEAWPSQTTMAADLRWSERTVRRWLAALEERGAIRREKRGPGAPDLIILEADVETVESKPAVSGRSKADSSRAQGGQICPNPEGVTSIGEPNYEPGDELTLVAESELPPAHSVEDEFASWWAVYPKKVDKADAFKVFVKLRKAGTSLESLLRAARYYAAHRQGEDPQFTKGPARFLRAGWADWADGPPEGTVRERAPRARPDGKGPDLEDWRRLIWGDYPGQTCRVCGESSPNVSGYCPPHLVEARRIAAEHPEWRS